MQTTLAAPVTLTGVGIHTGETVSLTLHPAEVDTGIVFRRDDLPDKPCTEAHVNYVTDTMLGTTLCNGSAEFKTIEHVLSALSGLEIDNVLISTNGCEFPVLDGSAMAVVFLIQEAGVVEVDATRRYIRLTQPIELEDVASDDGLQIRLEPYDGFQIRYTLDYDHPLFTEDDSSYCYEHSKEDYVRSICRARTFGFSRDLEYMHAQNKCLAANRMNALVIGDFSVLNQAGLRYKDEFARHKILDALGDFYLLGAPLLAKIDARKSGHTSNVAMMRKLLEHTECFEYVDRA